MSSNWKRAIAWLPALLIVALACAEPALAQDEEVVWRDPNISWIPASKPYIQWIAGVLLIAVFLLAAFKNPHRSHLD